MSTNERYTYSNPTIQEAALEINFRADEGSWTPLSFGKFFEKVMLDFPTIENVPAPMFTIERGSPVTVQLVTSPTQILRYKHRTRPLLLQLTENKISVFEVGSYTGWEQFKADIKYAWQNVMEVVQPVSVLQIGLRYINRIERSNPGESVGEWLQAIPNIPEAILGSHQGFLSQVVTAPLENIRISVVVTEFDATDPMGPFIFDIDIATRKETSTDTISLLGEIDHLHDTIWDIFSSAKTEKLERLLKGELS